MSNLIKEESKRLLTEQVRNNGRFIKMGSCVLDKGSCKRNWEMKWIKDHEYKQKLKDNAGRIYIIMSINKDGKADIKKIGKSESKGGLKTTFSAYQSGLGGSPSIRTFGIHQLITSELQLNNTIEIWCMWSKPIIIKVSGLFEDEEILTYPSVHSMEDKCRNDYKNAVGIYPPWNFQENKGTEWPDFIKLAYKEQVASRLTKKEKKINSNE
jgi:hypothetical protein